MKTLNNVTGEQVLERYCTIQNQGMLKDDYEHFSKVFDKWLSGIRNGSEEYSLDRLNYLGKKTRALLSVLDIKEPRTKKELTDIFNKQLTQQTN